MAAHEAEGRAAFHKRADIREAIAAAGHTLEFLPLLPRPQPHRAQVGAGQGHPPPYPMLH